MFDNWADMSLHLLLLKSSMVALMTSAVEVCIIILGNEAMRMLPFYLYQLHLNCSFILEDRYFIHSSQN